MEKHQILIVDDVFESIEILKAILHNENYKITYALNGKDALMLCASNNFDLILLDIMMPKMDGFEVCKHLRANKKTKNIPIIFTTAKVDKESIIKGFEVGAQDYLIKPFDLKEMVARIKTHLKLKEQHKVLKFTNIRLEERVAARTLELEKINSDLQKANRRLLLLENAKNDFLSIMSIELREPLNGIVGFTDMLDYSIKNKTHKKYVNYIKEACEKLIRISDMALLLSALRLNRYQISLNNYPAIKLIDEAVEKLKNNVKERKISIKTNIHKDLQITGDRKLLELSIEKILENCLEYSPTRSKIQISAEKTRRKVKISFTDEGIAFSDTELNYIFRSFKYEEIKKKKELLRYTQGLIVVKLAMDIHNAEIDVENLISGGVCINLILPVK